MPTTIQLPAGTEWVTVRSIPKLFAIALHGEPPSGNEMTAADMVWHGAVIEVEETIKRAVMQDELMPRNALSRRPMPDVRGEALHDAIVTVADLAEFAAQFVVGVSVEAAQTGTTPALAKVVADSTATTKEAKPKQDSHESTSHIATHHVPAPKRTNILDAVIQLAKGNAVKETDWQSVWASLVKLAEAKERPPPLLGFTDDEGVKYQDFSNVKFLSKKSFQQRWNRAKPAR